VHARGEGLCESRMREIRTSGSTRGEERCPPPLLLYRPISTRNISVHAGGADIALHVGAPGPPKGRPGIQGAASSIGAYIQTNVCATREPQSVG